MYRYLAVLITGVASIAQGQATNGSLRHTPLVDAVARAMPAVVNIHGQKTVDASATALGEAPRRVNGMGTGIVVDERGYILTNFHVIDGVQPIQVTLHDKRTYTARLVARDTRTDLAIIRIKAGHRLPTMRIGTSSDLMPAEPVIAIGNAFGYHGTITRGIISALNRTVEVTDSQRYFDLIQTDASINPGNSGGPLMNVDGEMIGINVAVRVGADGIAFAIPVDRAMEVAARLMAAGQTTGTWHGLEGRSLVHDGKWSYVVERVAKGSPAADSGLRPGDQVVRIGKVAIERQLDVERALLGLKPGTEAPLEIIRKEQSFPIQLVVATLPDEQRSSTAEQIAWNRLGIRATPVSPTLQNGLEGNYRGGLRVTAIREDSAAARHGIQVGDILVGLQKFETTSLNDLDYVLNKVDSDSTSVPFYVVRNSVALESTMDLIRR